MAFKEISKNESADVIKKYWKPNAVNEQIEGHILKFDKDKYNNECLVLVTDKNDETNQFITTTLPGHRSLQIHYKKLKPGDYIRVTYLGMKTPQQEGKRAFNDYKIEIDAERFEEQYNLVLGGLPRN